MTSSNESELSATYPDSSQDFSIGPDGMPSIASPPKPLSPAYPPEFNGDPDSAAFNYGNSDSNERISFED